MYVSPRTLMDVLRRGRIGYFLCLNAGKSQPTLQRTQPKGVLCLKPQQTQTDPAQIEQQFQKQKKQALQTMQQAVQTLKQSNTTNDLQTVQQAQQQLQQASQLLNQMQGTAVTESTTAI